MVDPIPVTENPTVVPYGYIDGRIILSVGDSTDVGREPDPVPATLLKITFISTAILDVAGPPRSIVLPQAVVCTVDSEGFLVDPTGTRGVWLVAGWWTVKYSEYGLKDSNFELLDTHTLASPFNLANTIPPGGEILTASEYTILSDRIDAGIGYWYTSAVNSGTRWDQTAGRAAYAWDPINSREQLIYADTGFRNMGAALINGWTATSILLRRVGYRCTARIYGLNAAGMTAANFMGIPAGFSALDADARVALFTSSTPAVAYRTATSGGLMLLPGATTATPPLNGLVEWYTKDAWPATLPGTANDAIPNL